MDQAPLAKEQLESILRDARARRPRLSIWHALCEAGVARDQEVAAALESCFDVRVLSDDALRAAQVTNVDAGDGGPSGASAWLVLENQALLLCEDPWSPATMFALNAQPDARLALAKPGQLESLVSTPVNSSATVETADSPVVAFVDSAVERAYREGASDIHFESDHSGIALKYRIDGVMAPGERLEDPRRAEEVISRIKVMAQLDITERRRPQDGRIHWQQPNGPSLDLRVSIMPSIHGEDAVLRLLDKAQLRHNESTVSLDSLGFDEELASRIRELAARPHGMLLVTGPTGSGKTTTVYAALSEVNDGLEKIITIEDPVEYQLAGVLQIPVNEQKGLTFATGLRSILRHDPDKILVGEIRDAETTEIAVQSSLTGHLVMTTVHANSLFDVLGRFHHFGIDPFGLASALNGVVVQRLLRKLCAHCGTEREATADEQRLFASLELSTPSHLPKPRGCSSCRGSGYRSRMVVAEVHELSNAHRDMIVRRAPLTEIRAAVYSRLSETLLARALAMVAGAQTTMEEVRRVVGIGTEA